MAADSDVVAKLTAAQRQALQLLADDPDGTKGQPATIRNGPKWVGFQTAKALERMGYATVTPSTACWWVEITDEGQDFLAANR